MTPKEQIKEETKRITKAIKAHFSNNKKLISDIPLAEIGIESTLISDNIINGIFYAQKEVYFNAEFSKFKTVITQQIRKAGLKPVEYTKEYIAKTPNAELPNKMFSLTENLRAYEQALSEHLESLKNE